MSKQQKKPEKAIKKEQTDKENETISAPESPPWESTTASPGKFRIFWKDTFDGSQGRHIIWSAYPEKKQIEWDDLESAKAHVIKECIKNPAYHFMYIFDDQGRQVWHAGTDIPH